MTGSLAVEPQEPAVNPRVRVKWLARATSACWLEAAMTRPDLLLVDHAHCERKAAGVALQLMFRYPSDAQLGAELSVLAREELEHFEQVLALLQSRGIPLRRLQAPAYGAKLTAQVRRCEPDRMLDSFLVAGLIEARSHERMGLLASHSPDSELRQMYSELLASESRHFGLYWLLAEDRYGRQATVERMKQLAEVEAAALEGHLEPVEFVRMHSKGVEAT